VLLEKKENGFVLRIEVMGEVERFINWVPGDAKSRRKFGNGKIL